eukprot:scaffold24398_cov133-Isochrysis_galbana.AAC.11
MSQYCCIAGVSFSPLASSTERVDGSAPRGGSQRDSVKEAESAPRIALLPTVGVTLLAEERKAHLPGYIRFREWDQR